MSLNSIQRIIDKLSIRLRLTLAFVAIFGSALVIFGVSTFKFISADLQKEFDEALYNYAVDVADSVSLNASGDLSVLAPEVDKQKIYPFLHGTALIQIRTLKGIIVFQEGDFGSLDLPHKKDFKKLEKGEEVTFRTISKLEGLPSKEAENYRVISFVLDDSPIPVLILQIAVPLGFLDRQLQSRKLFFQASIPVIILISTLASIFLSSQALSPITKIIDKAEEIGAHQLSERLPIPLAHDELQRLAISLNKMLERLEKSFQNQERFVADASHQLLSPLTILKGELESSQKINAESLLQEVDSLIAIVNNMLILARVDAGLYALTLQELYLEELIFEAIKRCEKIAKKKNIKIKFNLKTNSNINSERPKIQGDEELLIITFYNIIENAIKYSASNEVVDVTLEWGKDEQKISISDHGPGISSDEMDYIFQRFSRSQKTSGSAPGYGLGLAIAKKICDLHNAKLSFESKNGTTFHFEIKNF